MPLKKVPETGVAIAISDDVSGPVKVAHPSAEESIQFNGNENGRQDKRTNEADDRTTVQLPEHSLATPQPPLPIAIERASVTPPPADKAQEPTAPKVLPQPPKVAAQVSEGVPRQPIQPEHLAFTATLSERANVEPGTETTRPREWIRPQESGRSEAISNSGVPSLRESSGSAALASDSQPGTSDQSQSKGEAPMGRPLHETAKGAQLEPGPSLVAERRPADEAPAEKGSPVTTSSKLTTPTPDAAPVRQGTSHATKAPETTTPQVPVEPEVTTLPRSQSPVRNITVRQDDVEIRMVDRGGTIHVAVQTPDAHLSRSLQSNLPEFVAQLDRRGIDTQTWQGSTGAAALKSDSALTEGLQARTPSDMQQSGRDPSDGHQGRGRQQQQQPDWWERHNNQRPQPVFEEEEL